jgi:hypothetical protein
MFLNPWVASSVAYQAVGAAGGVVSEAGASVDAGAAVGAGLVVVSVMGTRVVALVDRKSRRSLKFATSN